MSRDNRKGGPGGRSVRPAADISSAIELYQPKRVGADSPAALEASLPSAREWVAAAEPRSAKQARRMMLVTAEYVLWAYQRGIPMKALVALNRQNVNHWIFKVKNNCDGRWQGNAKWVLQRVGKAVGAGGWPQEQIAVKRTDPAAPYDAAQEQSFRQQAAQRHRQSRSERLFVAVGACGCGMSGREISLACRGDFADLGGERIGLRVGGRNPRLVPIRADYTPLARMAAESAPDDRTAFIAGAASSRVHKVARDFIARDSDGLSLPRARSTWLRAHLRTGTPLAALRKTAGPVSADTLNFLLAQCAADLDDLAAAQQALRP